MCMQPASASPLTNETRMNLGTPPSAALVLQSLTDTGAQSEDCLTLNVWTKRQNGESKKAVLVWIHGGGFVTGSSRIPAYSGKFIADQEDVVVVSLK
jgi:carboxylesterase type B